MPFERVVADLGVVAVARCGHRLEHLEMVTADQAAKLGAWGVIASVQPNFDLLWGGGDGMYARRLGAERASQLNPLALLASQGVPLALGSDAPVTGLDPWVSVRAAVNHHTPGSARVGPGRIRRRDPRRLAGLRCPRRQDRHPGARCARLLRRMGRRQPWTSTPRTTASSAGRPIRVPGCPRCRRWARPTPCRVAAKPCIEALSSMAKEWLPHRRPARPPDASPGEIESGPGRRSTTSKGGRAARTRRAREPTRTPNRHRRASADGPDSLAGRLGAAARRAPAKLGARRSRGCPPWWAAMLPRLARLVVTVAGGLLLCASFPSVNWWWAAVVAAALLGWVLTHPATTPVGGLGYGFLFGLAFYAAAAAVDQPVWSATCRGCCWRRCARCFPASSACSPSWCADCPAGRSGSRWCGRPRSG